MAGNRTLKLSILADTADLVKGLNTAQNETEKSSGRIGNAFAAVGKAALAAGAAVAAYGVKLAIDGVKAALDDEKAQRVLAQTLENTTGATLSQIAAVEEYITTTSLAVGVTDDQLRPAFARLLRSTKDITDAQKLLSLALDVSTATGKPLESIANSLGKAYDGNSTALGRLGLGIDSNILKSKDFSAIYESLRQQFDGFAKNEAETFAGKVARLKVAFDETKESIGFALLPTLNTLFTYFNTKLVPILVSHVVPGIEAFIKGLTGDRSITQGAKSATDAAFKFGEQIKDVITFVIRSKDELILLGQVIAGVFLVSKVTAFITTITALISTMKLLRTAAATAGVAVAFATGGTSVALAAGALATTAAVYGLLKFAEDDNDLKNLTARSFQTQSIREAERLGLMGGGGFGPTGGLFENAVGITPKQISQAIPTVRGLTKEQQQSLRDDLGLISQFGGVIEGLNEKFGDPFFGFGKGFNVAESIRTGIPVTNRNPTPKPQTVNVNVTGNLIDPAGAARAIAEIIRNEGARNGALPLVGNFVAQ